MQNMEFALAPGTVLANGAYRLDMRPDRYVLGAGGFGITYLAKQTKLDRPVAVKELFVSGACVRVGGASVSLQSIDDFETFKKNFVREGHTLAKFNHPSIVRVYDVFEENGTVYMAMEFVEGKSLREIVIQYGSLKEEVVKDFGIQLSEALEEVHGHGLLHRDIAPDNIIITPKRKAVLLDFGIAREYDKGGAAVTNTVMLKHGYAPPEQYSPKRPRGPYTDLYALGATLFFALTGKKPESSIDREQGDGSSDAKRYKPTVSEHFRALLIKSMELKAEKRFQSAAEMRAELTNTPVASFSVASPPPPSSPVVEKTRIVPSPKPSDFDAPTTFFSGASFAEKSRPSPVHDKPTHDKKETLDDERIAAVTPRLLSFVTDAIAYYAVFFLLSGVIGNVLAHIAEDYDDLAYHLSEFFVYEKNYAVILLSFVYHPLFDWMGGSLGKRIMGLKALDLSTQRPPALWKLYAKAAFAAFLCFVYYVPLALSMLGVFWTKNRQALHEILLNVAVVKK